LYLEEMYLRMYQFPVKLKVREEYLEFESSNQRKDVVENFLQIQVMNEMRKLAKFQKWEARKNQAYLVKILMK